MVWTKNSENAIILNHIICYYLVYDTKELETAFYKLKHKQRHVEVQMVLHKQEV